MSVLFEQEAGIGHVPTKSNVSKVKRPSGFYKNAIITSQKSMSPVHGRIRNDCESGVQLEVDDANAVPTHFQLEVLRDRYIVDCSISWREGNMIGAEFESELIEVPRLHLY